CRCEPDYASPALYHGGTVHGRLYTPARGRPVRGPRQAGSGPSRPDQRRARRGPVDLSAPSGTLRQPSARPSPGGGAAGARQRTPSCTGRPPTSRRSWMNLTRRLLLVLAGVLLATGATAQGTFNYPMSADPEHLDPWRSTTVATRRILVNVYEGLTTLDGRTAEVVPALATGWDISEDGLTYTFHLRQGVL